MQTKLTFAIYVQKMKPYNINVVEIEALQTISDQVALNKIFEQAKSTIVNGEVVTLYRKTTERPVQNFDTITTLEDLEDYRKGVFKYL